MHAFVNTAIKAARSAGNIIMQAQDKIEHLRVSEKNKNDLVTDADIASENEIISILQEAYPDHDIIAEESGHHPSGKEAEYTWLIDPIDGTMNFAHGFPYFCISIACLYKGRVEHGVIYNPNTNDLFTASRGQGAQKNSRKMRVSSRQNLEKAMIATGLPSSAEHLRHDYMTAQSYLGDHCASTRRSGAAALDLAHVASGQLDGFWEMCLKPWDVAAGSLMVKEAGGIVCDFNGNDDYLKSGHIICANPKLFKRFLETIKPYLPREVLNK